MTKSKSILVTGGAGYIGSHTVVELHQAGYHPVIIDNLSRSNQSMLDGLHSILGVHVPFYQADCCDAQKLVEIIRRHDVGCIMHFAAFKSVNESVANPLLYYRNNIDSLVAVLEAMRATGVSDLVFSSSCTVYGQPDQIPVDELAPFKRAESPYGATKQMSERIIEDAVQLGLRTISLRYFNPIGAHPSSLIGELPIGVPNNLVPYVTQTAIGLREKLTIFGGDYNTPDGTCVRDFIHVCDVAEAHVKAMEYLQQQPNKHFLALNLGTGVGISVKQLVETFIHVTGVNLNWIMGPRRDGDVEKVYANPELSASRLRWKSSRTLEQSLADAWSWEKAIRKGI